MRKKKDVFVWVSKNKIGPDVEWWHNEQPKLHKGFYYGSAIDRINLTNIKRGQCKKYKLAHGSRKGASK